MIDREGKVKWLSPMLMGKGIIRSKRRPSSAKLRLYEEDEVDNVDVTGVSILSRQQEEIFVDGIPIGYVLLNEDGVTFRAEIYDNYLHTKEDVTMLRKFIEVVDKYTWVED